MSVKPFMGNPCGAMHCMSADCENCKLWSPCIYYRVNYKKHGTDYREIKLPKWKWLVNLLYKIEGKVLQRGNSNEF